MSLLKLTLTGWSDQFGFGLVLSQLGTLLIHQNIFRVPSDNEISDSWTQILNETKWDPATHIEKVIGSERVEQKIMECSKKDCPSDQPMMYTTEFNVNISHLYLHLVHWTLF